MCPPDRSPSSAAQGGTAPATGVAQPVVASTAGGSGFSSSLGISLAFHGALVATLALSLRPWAAPSDASRGQEFLAQLSAPAPAPAPSPVEVVEAVTPPRRDATLPEEPLLLPEAPTPPLEVAPPSPPAPVTSHLLESVVYPSVEPLRRPAEEPAVEAPSPAEELEAPTAAEAAETHAAKIQPPGPAAQPSSPEPLEGLCVPPVYPAVAARRGWTGTVVLLIEVSADGTVGRVTVETTSGHVVLDDAATRAVREWRFAPAMLNGTPAPASVRKPIRFGPA
ncbi:MAG: energy transducer TonB [Planctomycetota bacterium]